MRSWMPWTPGRGAREDSGARGGEVGMTHREAIERLSNLYRVVAVDGLGEYNSDVRHNMAIDLAIEALKAQEHPTDECIRNAIFCLQNPHDCLETEVDEAQKMLLYALKARELKMVAGVAEIYKDILVGNCPSCGQTVVSNVKKPTKYCRFCGQAVKWE